MSSLSDRHPPRRALRTRRRPTWAWSPVLVAVACANPPPPALTDAGPSPGLALEAPPASPADVVVARVDGHPVWGSCVTAQANGHPERRRDALHECVALEVAAQEAQRRELDRDPDVLAALPRVLAARLVDRELTAKIRTFADLPPDLVEATFAKQAHRMERPELRGSFFARIELDQQQAGTAADRAAEAAARAAYAALAGRADLFPADVEDQLRTAAAGMKVTSATPDMSTRDSVLQPYYRDALFGLSTIGTVAAPVRGPYGWDLILYTNQLPPWTKTRDQILSELFPAMRLRYFDRWSAQLGKGHDVRILVDDEALRAALGGDSDPAPVPAVRR